jgi:hypothetical protein
VRVWLLCLTQLWLFLVLLVVGSFEAAAVAEPAAGFGCTVYGSAVVVPAAAAVVHATTDEFVAVDFDFGIEEHQKTMTTRIAAVAAAELDGTAVVVAVVETLVFDFLTKDAKKIAAAAENTAA